MYDKSMPLITSFPPPMPKSEFLVGDLAKNNLKINSQLANSFRHRLRVQTKWDFDNLPFLEHFFISASRLDMQSQNYLSLLKVDYDVLSDPYHDLVVCPFAEKEALDHIKIKLLPWIERFKIEQSVPIYYDSIFFDYPLRFIRLIYEGRARWPALSYCPKITTYGSDSILLNNCINLDIKDKIISAVNDYKKIIQQVVECKFDINKVLIAIDKNKTPFYLLNFLKSLNLEKQLELASKVKDVQIPRKLLRVINKYHIPNLSILEFYRTLALSNCEDKIPTNLTEIELDIIHEINFKNSINDLCIDNGDNILNKIITPRLRDELNKVDYIDMVSQFIVSKNISNKVRDLIIKASDLERRKKHDEIAKLILSFDRDDSRDVQVHSFIIVDAATKTGSQPVNSFVKMIEPIVDTQYLDSIAIKCAMAIYLESKEKWLTTTIKYLSDEIIDDAGVFTYEGDDIELEIFINILHNSMLYSELSDMGPDINRGCLTWLTKELGRTTKANKYFNNKLNGLYLCAGRGLIKKKIEISQSDLDNKKIVFVLKKRLQEITNNKKIENDLEDCISDPGYNPDSDKLDVNLVLMKAKNKEFTESSADTVNFPLFDICVYYEGKIVKRAPREVLYMNAVKNNESNTPNKFCKKIKATYEAHKESEITRLKKSGAKVEEILGDDISSTLILRARDKEDKSMISEKVMEVLSDSFTLKGELNKFTNKVLLIPFELHDSLYFHGNQKFTSLLGQDFDFKSNKGASSSPKNRSKTYRNKNILARKSKKIIPDNPKNDK